MITEMPKQHFGIAGQSAKNWGASQRLRFSLNSTAPEA